MFWKWSIIMIVIIGSMYLSYLYGYSSGWLKCDEELEYLDDLEEEELVNQMYEEYTLPEISYNNIIDLADFMKGSESK